MRSPESTDSEYIDLITNRNRQRVIYTDQATELGLSFVVMCELHKSQLTPYWGEAGATRFMDWLTDYAFCYADPVAIVIEWANKGLDIAKQGVCAEEMGAGIDTIYYPPVFGRNDLPGWLAYREAEATKQAIKATKGKSRIEQIRAAMGGVKFNPPANN